MVFKRYKLSDICDLNFSSITSKDTYNNILYLDTSSITNNIIESLQTLSIKEAPSRAKRKVTHDTIIYSTVRPNLKHFGILKNPADNLIVSTGFTTIDVKDYYNEYIDADYLYLLLANQSVVDYLSTMAESAVSSYPSINPDDIGELSFYFPDIDLQRKIAATVFLLENKISLNTRLNAELEAMAKQLYDYWFVQFDFPDENGKPYRSSGGKMVYNEKLKREIPEGWHCGNLFEIAKFTNGLACQKFRPKPDEKPLPVIKIREMHDGFTVDTEEVTPNIPDSVKVFNGDILFAWSASLEVMLWAFGEGGLNQHIFKVTSANGFPKSFYYYQLLDYVDVFKKMAEARKTTMGHITQDHLQQSTIAIPDDISITNSFEERVSPIFDQHVKLQEEITQLTKQRDELLPLLMNGQVVVCDDDVLYHGTDISMLEMSNEERIQYLSDCKLVINALSTHCESVEAVQCWQADVYQSEEHEFGISDLCSGNWAYPLFKFFRDAKNGQKGNALDRFSKIEGREIYLTNDDFVAEEYANMAAMGGEMGLVAYSMIKKVEERQIHLMDDDVEKAIAHIKHFIAERKHEPVVIKVDRKDLDAANLMLEEEIEISFEIQLMYNQWMPNSCYNFKYLKPIDFSKCDRNNLEEEFQKLLMK